MSAADYHPPTANEAPDAERLKIRARLSTPFLTAPPYVELAWQNGFDLHPHWTAHVAGRMCGIACDRMGLSPLDIEFAVRAQRDAIAKDRSQVLRPRDAAVAHERISFLTHRGEAPGDIERPLQAAFKADAGWTIYCAVEFLASMLCVEPITTTDIHEVVRQWRDRWSGTQNERRIWTPSDYH